MRTTRENVISDASSSEPARRLLHTRRIVCEGFERSDGLFDIEARMQDVKTDDADLLLKQVRAGEPIHAMRLTVTVDTARVIHRVVASTDAGPTPYCAEINAAYARLAGIALEAGFMKQVKERVGGAFGCTHLTELLGPIATTAIQTLMGKQGIVKRNREASGESLQTPAQPMLDTCHAWRADGEVVQFVRERERRSLDQDPSAGRHADVEGGSR